MTTSVTTGPRVVGCMLVASNSCSIAQVACRKSALQRKAEKKRKMKILTTTTLAK